MTNIVDMLAEWSNFTAEREAERHRLMNPPGIADKKAELAAVNQEIARLRAQQHLLKAQIAMASHGETYNRAVFDAQWAEKKQALKDELEKAFLVELSGGKSIPKIMKEYNFTNPVWLYQIREQLTRHQHTEAAKLKDVTWEWSDFSGTHRYALAKGEDGKWAYCKMLGALDTDLEGESCVWEIATGELLSGSQEVFNSDSQSGRTKRQALLASILDETYTGAIRQSPNPYFQ